jgi:hypothetical protein
MADNDPKERRLTPEGVARIRQKANELLSLRVRRLEIKNYKRFRRTWTRCPRARGNCLGWTSRKTFAIASKAKPCRNTTSDRAATGQYPATIKPSAAYGRDRYQLGDMAMINGQLKKVTKVYPNGSFDTE